jgi:hypothetical protein
MVSSATIKQRAFIRCLLAFGLSTVDEREPYLSLWVISVHVDQDERLPGPQLDLPGDNRDREGWGDESREDVVGPMPGRTVTMRITVIPGQQSIDRFLEILF